MKKFTRLPQHIGIIPDGNRRWAQNKGLDKKDGYTHGIDPGFELYKACLEIGIKEMTFYGFTSDNTKRPPAQIKAFQKACVDAVERLKRNDADLLIVGNTKSSLFPKELLAYTKRTRFGKGLIKVNFLVNYDWKWDLQYALKNNNGNNLVANIASADISRIDLIIRWGGRCRLSGFIPVQSVYADFYFLDAMWPDFTIEHLYQALEWYQNQDVTLGG